MKHVPKEMGHVTILFVHVAMIHPRHMKNDLGHGSNRPLHVANITRHMLKLHSNMF